MVSVRNLLEQSAFFLYDKDKDLKKFYSVMWLIMVVCSSPSKPQLIPIMYKYDMHISAGSVLLQDEANSSSDVAINMDALERDRYQQQMQLIEQDVSHGLWLNILYLTPLCVCVLLS